MSMEISMNLLRQMESDLGLNTYYVKGQDKAVKNCWHFYSDGNDVDEMFYDEEDFRRGMNRIFVTLRKHRVIILAFALMDTHFHFVLYGTLSECQAFAQDYLLRTSRHIAIRHGDNNKLRSVKVCHQPIDTDFYLKTVICYTIKNPSVGGKHSMSYNYPWSSGALYFCGEISWASCNWRFVIDSCPTLQDMKVRDVREMLCTKDSLPSTARIIDGIVFPGDYVAYQVVERLFVSYRGFQYFLGISKESDIESRGGMIANLTLPMQEMRQHKTEMCQALFGKNSTKTLDTSERIKLARTLRHKYNSSLKQIIRLCGLNYDECKDLI